MKMNPLRRKLALGLGVSVIAYAATPTILGAGTETHSEVLGGPATVNFRNLLTPGEVGTWHYHPGKMVNIVKRGAVTVEDGCGGGETYTAGQLTVFTPNNTRLCGPARNVDECKDGGWTSFNHPTTFATQIDQRLTELERTVLALNKEGVIHAKAQRYQEAIALIQKAIRLEPSLAGLYNNLGVIYLNWDRPADALEPLQYASKLQPNCGQSHFYLGVANSRLSYHQEAIANYEDAIRYGLTEPALYSNLGWSYYIVGKPSKALESLARAEKLAPDDVGILHNLGVVHASFAHYNEAATKLQRALFLRPTSVLTRYNLGCVYAVQGNRAAALEQYKILKTQDPETAHSLYQKIYGDAVVAIKPIP
jgi:Flp pilus assembly protein TadD